MIRSSSHNEYIFFQLFSISIIWYCRIFSEYEYLYVVAIIIRVYESLGSLSPLFLCK
jgi:hypothetical protein